MKVALIGITGQVGSRLAAELLRRGHKVTGRARRPQSGKTQAGLEIRQSHPVFLPQFPSPRRLHQDAE